MADITETERIGLELQKRKAEQKQESAAEVRPAEVAEEPTVDDEIDAELKTRVHEILSAGTLTNVDVAQVILPDSEGEKKNLFAKFQFRRKRQNYDQLKRSIKELGVLEYIVLKKESGIDGVNRYYLLDGHTRFNILQELIAEDPTTLVPPFLVVECDDGDATLIAEILNRFSENLDGEDKPFSVIRMFEIGGVSQKEIARRMNYSESMVSEIIGAFRDVPQDARTMIETRQWSVKHGIQLARLKRDKDEQLRIFENAKRYRYSAERLKKVVHASKERDNFVRKAKKHLEEELAERESKVVTTA
ncbi:MAG: ParB/RepB/Spo0J family partition protein, partial [Candidatus Thorarchaeota archaeon]